MIQPTNVIFCCKKFMEKFEATKFVIIVNKLYKDGKKSYKTAKNAKSVFASIGSYTVFILREY